MAPHHFVEQLLRLPDLEAQKLCLAENRAILDDDTAAALKERADSLLRFDIQGSLHVAALLSALAETTANPVHRALALLAEANAQCIGLGEHQRALQLYDGAVERYDSIGERVEEAKAQIARVWCLACLGCYQEAIDAGRRAGQVLEAAEEWLPLAKLTANLGILHGRLGEDAQALDFFDRARQTAAQIGASGRDLLARIEQNRAIVLRNLGRFEESIGASEQARAMLKGAGQRVEAARAEQNLAVTYYVLGRYNEALELLGRVGDVFSADGRERDAVLVRLFISDCLLRLRRFPDVLSNCREVREHFSGLGTRLEVGQTLLNEAVAHAGLGRYRQALSSIAEAQHLFSEEGNEVYCAGADLERAAILLRQGQLEESREAVEACGAVFRDRGLSVKAAQSYIVAARIAAAQGEHQKGSDLAGQALAVGQSKDIPSITYQCHHLLGSLAQAQDDAERALGQYDLGVSELERLRGRVMVEFRAGFLEDKQAVYEDAVCLCLELNQPRKGLEYAGRAKSRALLDLLAHRLDLSPRPRTARDRSLVEELQRLRATRDRLWRRWESEAAAYAERGEESRVQDEVLSLENRITDLWHQLLVRNASYARDASLCHVLIEPIEPFLDEDTVLLEYFFARGKLITFVVTGEEVQARQLPVSADGVQRLLALLGLNLRTAARTPPDRLEALAENARGLLQQLNDLLLSPIVDLLSTHERLIVVPHGPLHYLPFHALYDGRQYLLQRQKVSYLPGSSILRYCRESRPGGTGMTVFGYSCQGRLPHAVDEARAIAELGGGELALEDEATVASLRRAAAGCRILHLATHGDFRADNPLFSGLALADGWLTTMDIFGMRLNTSLVTLSACQTGRSVVGGGDELLGLMRALLYAGSASLALSLWPVADRSTAQLMQAFYGKLAEGWTKVAALRHAQLSLLGREGDPAGRYAHPYYWAPFFLVGECGHI
jgi:CHAT domain-containing protein